MWFLDPRTTSLSGDSDLGNSAPVSHTVNLPPFSSKTGTCLYFFPSPHPPLNSPSHTHIHRNYRPANPKSPLTNFIK